MTKVVASFSDRLNEALEKRDMRPVDLANKADIPEATISQYRSGYAKPKYERIVRIADALRVSLTWLMGGDVPMEKSHKMPPIKHFDISNIGQNSTLEFADPEDYEKMRELYRQYQQALPQIQAAVDSLLNTDKHNT